MKIRQNIIEKLDYMIIFSIYITCFAIFISNALINFGAILTILFALIKLIMNKGKLNYDYYGFLLPMGLFSLSILLSGINHWNDDILTNKFTFSFIFFFIVINEVKENKQVKNMIYLLITSSLIGSIYGLYQYFYLGFNRIKSFSFSLTFGNLIAVMVIFFTIYIIWGDFSKRTKFILLVFDIIFFVSLLLTKSRGAWLAFFGGIVILGFIKSRKFMIISLIILILIFALLPSQYTQRFKSSFDISYDVQNNRSNTYRIAMWITALNIFKNYPVLGLGYYNFRTSLSDPYKVDLIKDNGFIHVHNTFLEILAEQGLMGFISFLYLMFTTSKKIYIYYKSSSNLRNKLFHISTIIGISIFIIQGMTQYNFGKTEPLAFFWLIIAISVLYNKLEFEIQNI